MILSFQKAVELINDYIYDDIMVEKEDLKDALRMAAVLMVGAANLELQQQQELQTRKEEKL